MVRRLVTAQDPALSGRGPCQPRTLQLAGKILSVDAIEVCIQVLPSAFCNRRPGAPSSSRTGAPRTLLHGALEDETTIEGMVFFVHPPSIDFCQQYQRQRLEDAFG